MTYLNIYGFGIKAFQTRQFKIQVSKRNLKETSKTSRLEFQYHFINPQKSLL